MTDLTPWHEQYAALAARLASPTAAAEREELKRDIIALFKTLERHITEATALKDSIRSLVDQWKSLEAPSVVPAFAADRPVVHADHIGASTFVEKGWSRLSLGDHEGAEQALMRALELSPGDPEAESLLGWAQMLQENYEPALATFQRVLVRDPQHAVARMNLGYICLKQGIFGEAIEHLSKVIRMQSDPKATLYAHFYLGLVYLEREMFEDAQNFLQKAIALGPNLIEAHYELGWAQWLNDEHEAAVATWAGGHATGKFNPWGKRCRQLLDQIEQGTPPSREA